MPDKNANLEDDFDNPEEASLDSTDFGFIISGDGELKSMMYPEKLEGELPEEIVLILEILGIDITAPKGLRTLH